MGVVVRGIHHGHGVPSSAVGGRQRHCWTSQLTFLYLSFNTQGANYNIGYTMKPIGLRDIYIIANQIFSLVSNKPLSNGYMSTVNIQIR